LIYLDTSIVAPLYWTEALSDTVEELVLSETELGLSQLVEVELISALSRRVSRFTTPLRTLDALHLAVASQNNVRLLTADAGLAASAQFLEVDVLLLE
jgi:uncharacterized protein